MTDTITLTREIAKALAAEAGVALDSRIFHRYEFEAYQRVAAWRRAPGHAQTKVERLLDMILANDREEHRQRQARAEFRQAIGESFVAGRNPPEDPNFVRIVVRNERTGSLVRIALPVEQVETTWEG